MKAFVPAIAMPDLRRARSGRVLRKRMRSIAVLFVDIENCTHRCEDLPPRAMNAVIETYFSEYPGAVIFDSLARSISKTWRGRSR